MEVGVPHKGLILQHAVPQRLHPAVPFSSHSMSYLLDGNAHLLVISSFCQQCIAAELQKPLLLHCLVAHYFAQKPAKGMRRGRARAGCVGAVQALCRVPHTSPCRWMYGPQHKKLCRGACLLTWRRLPGHLWPPQPLWPPLRMGWSPPSMRATGLDLHPCTACLRTTDQPVPSASAPLYLGCCVLPPLMDWYTCSSICWLRLPAGKGNVALP